jgi:hypothetical protein
MACFHAIYGGRIPVSTGGCAARKVPARAWPVGPRDAGHRGDAMAETWAAPCGSEMDLSVGPVGRRCFCTSRADRCVFEMTRAIAPERVCKDVTNCVISAGGWSRSRKGRGAQ